MQKKILTETENAQSFLLTYNQEKFEQTLLQPLNSNLIGVVLYYYQAKGQLGRLIQKETNSFSEAEIINFKANSLRLENLKKEVFKENLITLIKKYNESIIMGALVSLIRDTEANILTYDDHLMLKEKFFSWPKLGIDNDRILLSWKDFSNAIREVEDWLIEKKNSYLTVLEKLIKVMESNDNVTEGMLYEQLQDIPEKECFYIICNILLTNPILRREFLSISQLKADKLLAFEKSIFRILTILEEKTSDNSLKGLILLFKQQIKDAREELTR